MSTQNLTEKTFSETIDKGGIVFVDFWAEWCGPCKAFAPVYEKTSEKHPDIVFGKVNTEEEPSLAAAFQVSAIPTLMIFRDGILLFAQPGMVPAAALEDLIGQVRDLDMDEVRKKVEEAKREQGPEATA